MVFEVDLDDNTPMSMVSEAAEQVQKLPKGMHYRLIVINFYELNSCHLTVSVGSTKLLTDCTGSKWCETLLKRTPVTHSSGKLTGGARTKHWKINCILFLLESNDSGRFQMKKRAVEAQK